MEATVRLLENEPNITVQVLWRGTELNLLRSREEPVERFLQRLGLSCSKQASKLLSGPDRKKAKKEIQQKQKATGAEVGTNTASSLNVALFDANDEKVAVGTPVAEALRRASHMEIEGERLPICVNPPSVQKLEVFGRAIVGCPLSAILRCEFCDAASFKLRWLTQVAAGAAGAVEIGLGNILWVPQDAKGRTLHLEAEPDRSIAVSSRSKGTLRVGLVEEGNSSTSLPSSALQRQEDKLQPKLWVPGLSPKTPETSTCANATPESISGLSGFTDCTSPQEDVFSGKGVFPPKGSEPKSGFDEETHNVGWKLSNEKGRAFHFNMPCRESSWSHPREAFQEELGIFVDGCHKASDVQRLAAARGFLEELSARAQRDLSSWSGPYLSKEDRFPYWFNEEMQCSSWHDPATDWQEQLAFSRRFADIWSFTDRCRMMLELLQYPVSISF